MRPAHAPTHACAGASPDGCPRLRPQAHALWGKKNPALLAKIETLVVDRSTYNKLVPASESLTIEKPKGKQNLAPLRQDMMLRVLKREPLPAGIAPPPSPPASPPPDPPHPPR